MLICQEGSQEVVRLLIRIFQEDSQEENQDDIRLEIMTYRLEIMTYPKIFNIFPVKW